MKRKFYKIMEVLLLVCSCVLVLTACGSKSYLESTSETRSEKQAEDEDQEQTGSDDKQDSSSIWVQISGAVNQPGVYKLAEDSRVYAAIEAAGGFAENADTSSVNQAMKLKDEQQLVVLTVEESMKAREAAAVEEAQGSLVNLNTATKEQLMTLTGIGESKAEAILSYRTEHGGFTSPDEIMNISGIKEGAYNKIKNNITVN